MKKNLLKSLTVLLFILTGFSLQAQDIIIKTDKSEIKAKILEIEENTIKYKKAEFLDGPSYSISKAQVFMIIYKNGSRETFESSKPVVAATKPAETKEVTNLFTKVAETTKVATATAAEASTSDEITADTRVNYFPSRLWGSFSSLVVSLSAEQEFGLLPNYLNSGLATTITASEYVSGYGVGIFASGYLPVNRMTGNYENQDKGFFPFVRAGASFVMTDMDINGTTSSSSAFGFSTGVGADYKFTRGFGVSVMLSEFNSFGYGINFKF